jgi:LPXTG-site transpeptidase (sortase) family protein
MSTRSDTPFPPDGTDRSGWVERVLVVVSVSCCLLAIGIAATAIVRSSTPSEVVLDVTDATIAVAPSTVPPRPDPADVERSREQEAGEVAQRVGSSSPESSTRPATNTEPDGELEPDGSGAGRSPLADLLGPTYSVVPTPMSPRPTPVAVTASSIDIAGYPIRPVGLEEDGQLEVPDETEIGWYRYGATPGRAGATVLAAHVSWNRTTGPFFELGTMEPGDEITVTLDDGGQRTYLVTERTMYDKNELPRERIWRTTGDEQLVLITCGGDFNPAIRRYRQNIVVFASPIA